MYAVSAVESALSSPNMHACMHASCVSCHRLRCSQSVPSLPARDSRNPPSQAALVPPPSIPHTYRRPLPPFLLQPLTSGRGATGRQVLSAESLKGSAPPPQYENAPPGFSEEEEEMTEDEPMPPTESLLRRDVALEFALDNSSMDTRKIAKVATDRGAYANTRCRLLPPHHCRWRGRGMPRPLRSSLVSQGAPRPCARTYASHGGITHYQPSGHGQLLACSSITAVAVGP